MANTLENLGIVQFDIVKESHIRCYLNRKLRPDVFTDISLKNLDSGKMRVFDKLTRRFNKAFKTLSSC